MRCLLVNQFYPPDPAPTGQVLQDLAEALVERGHEVRVLCSQGSYDGRERYPAKGELNGVSLRRLPAWGLGKRGLAGRALSYAGFYAHAALRLFFSRPRPDLILALSTPPFLGLLARAAAALRGSLQVHWIMDLYPEVMEAHGMLKKRSPAYRLLEALNRAQLAKADLVLALGPYMAKRLRPQLGLHPGPGGGARLQAVALWPQGTSGASHGRALRRARWQGERFVLLYSGNMGLGHRFEEFLQAARLLGRDGPLWAFAGNGKRLPELMRFAQAHPQARIRFLDSVPQAQLSQSLGSADLLLASMQPSWEGLIVPSKIQGIFSAGRPVLFLGPRRSELAEWVRESGGGWCAEPGDLPGLLRALQEARDPQERRGRGQAALAYARRHFDRAQNTGRIAHLIESLAPPKLRLFSRSSHA
jgi:glycosyltransferase involved in cell wall biosynthesis